jgi:hypothetical protein
MPAPPEHFSRSLNVLANLCPFRYLRLWQRGSMVQRVSTVAFEGIEARAVDVQVQVAPGLPAFAIVGLPDKRSQRRASGCVRR